MKALLTNLERYAFCDPAGSKRGKTANVLAKVRARQAIIVLGIDHLLRIFVLYAWAGRLPASKLRDKVLEVYEEWQPRRFGIEDNAMQQLFGDLVIDEAKKTIGGNIRICGVPTSTKIEKNFKIRTTIEPVLNDGRLFIPEHLIELRAEIQGFPTWHLKDLVDCLAMAIMLIPRRAPQERQDDEKDALAKYLRDTGAPSWYIEQRMSGLVPADQYETAYGAPERRYA